MFSQLSSKILEILRKATSRGYVSERVLKEYADSVRDSLIDADTALAVADYVRDRILERGKTLRIEKAVNSDLQLLKITYEVIKGILGDAEPSLVPKGKPPVVVLFVGLQGSGKTTTVAKYGYYIKKKFKKEVLLCSVDVYRPGALDQLAELAVSNKLKFHGLKGDNPVVLAKAYLEYARIQGFEYLLIDTAGRLEVDERMMSEIQEIKTAINPAAVILVVDSMIGQAVVSVADRFHRQLGVTGVIASKFDSDTKGGGVLSTRWVTGAPILFVGTGERIDDLEPFVPGRVASRLLGQGDLEGLREKVEDVVDPKTSEQTLKRLQMGQFTFQDFVDQLDTVSKMGSFSRLLGMIPGFGSLANMIKDEHVVEKMKQFKAIVQSMTKEERENDSVLNESRLQRIAKGSGVKLDDVRTFVNQFRQMKNIIPQLSKMSPQALLNKFKGVRPF